MFDWLKRYFRQRYERKALEAFMRHDFSKPLTLPVPKVDPCGYELPGDSSEVDSAANVIEFPLERINHKPAVVKIERRIKKL